MTKKFYTVALAGVAASAVAIAPVAAADSFSDVTKNNAHYEAITALHAAKVISGYPDGTFKPALDVTRGQAAKMIAGALKLNTKDVKDPKFADIPTNHQYYGAIAALAALDAIEIYEDNTIEPQEKITRGELAFMIAQALGLEAEGDSPFEDVSEDNDYAYFVTALYEAGIAKGMTDTQFGVEKSVTRGQLASFVYNVVKDSTNGETTEPNEPTKPTEENPVVNEEIKAIFTKTLEKQAATNSMKAKITTSQAMQFKEGKETFSMDSKTDLTMSMVVKPMQYVLEGTMALVEPASGEKINVPLKMYMTEKDGTFMYDADAEKWMKFPAELHEAVLAQSGVQFDAAEQLKMLQQFTSSMDLKETDTHYVLNLKANGKEFTKFIMEQMKALNLGLSDEEMQEMGKIDFKHFTYEMHINKKTFDLDTMTIDMGLETEAEGTKITITSKSDIKYSDFNAVETITIPQDVLKNAEEAKL